MAALNLKRFPFYRERLEGAAVAPWTLADLEEFAAKHPKDPYAGRVIRKSPSEVSIQLEATGEPPVWAALSGAELGRWARVVARMWSRWGIAAGETIAFFEYGSSPLVLLASSGYVGYLKRGAAEILGISSICNDGVATMAPRMVSIVDQVRPSALIIRRELAAPFSAALESSGVTMKGRVRWVGLTEVEGAPSAAECQRLASAFEVPVYRILRADAAFVLAGECAQCRVFHLDREYQARASGGDVVITARFAATCPAINHSIGVARLLCGGCAAEPKSVRVEC
jgi:hypothetical protein